MTNIITVMNSVRKFVLWASTIVGVITNPIIKARRGTPIFIMAAFVIFLSACGSGGGGSGSGPTGGPIKVSGLQAIPGESSVSLIWDNPDAEIGGITISYRKRGYDNSLNILDVITDPSKMAAGARNVQANVTELEDREFYAFYVNLILTGKDAGREDAVPTNKNTFPVQTAADSGDVAATAGGGDVGSSILAASGKNSDGDGEPDFIDVDDNNDGKIDTDSDGDGTGDVVDADDDNDNVPDAVDVDDDGDGLIEIATAKEFNQIRNNLRGSSFKANADDDGDKNGCGNGEITKSCIGYELSADISLHDYLNWQPIGSCPKFDISSSSCTNINALFNVKLDGNGYTISNLTIRAVDIINGNAVGLFGAVGPDSKLHNIHIRDAQITEKKDALSNVGLLAGYARGANIMYSSATGKILVTADRVGGLVGDGQNATISASYAEDVDISGTNIVGGLVGDGLGSKIIWSYAAGGEVKGANTPGGLVGDGTDADIFSSYWDSDTSGIKEGNFGMAISTNDLQSPVNFANSIYADWEERICVDGTNAWRLGTASQYPYLTCTLNKLDAPPPPPPKSADDGINATDSKVSVSELGATPAHNQTTLIWNNPKADIDNIKISYRIGNSSAFKDLEIVSNSSKIMSEARRVEHIIENLENYKFYTFLVDLKLKGLDAGREGAPQFFTVAIGDDFDGDGLADFIDQDADGDGKEDKDTNGDGILDFMDDDDDDDGVPDALDVDANGNGLIDIATAEQLNQVRYNLQGNSFKSSAGGNANISGCGNMDIKECNGYELVADISLAAYDNWQPIGDCDTPKGCSDASSFNTIFEGNNYIISNLAITEPPAKYAGLFGVTGSKSQLSNIHIRAAKINGSVNSAGLLVGFARGGSIVHSSAIGEIKVVGGNVGGLVGNGQGTSITSSYVKSGVINADSFVGGLIGGGSDSTITLSYAEDVDVSGINSVGGLVGSAVPMVIILSYAEGGDVNGDGSGVGGLLGYGYGSSTSITSSYANIGSVSGADRVGGLVGLGSSVTIASSYAVNENIRGTATNSRVGGLIGYGSSTTVISSYWNSVTSGTTRSSGGGANAGSGEAKTTKELQSPTDFANSIYSDWEESKCDDDSSAWYLGTRSEYPSLTCSRDRLTVQSPLFSVTDLRADSGNMEVTLIWNNPDASIASINISYLINGSTDLQPLPPITSESKIATNAKNVKHTIEMKDLGEEGYYIFVVDLTLKGDNEGREGTAPSANVVVGPDSDGDGLVDFLDGDVDGNGLIEIATAEELDQIRYDLLDGILDANSGSAGAARGCGDQNKIKNCRGYELVADIPLATYDNWVPIGRCNTFNDCPNAYDGVFEGNGHTISDLTITDPVGNYVGLFGAVSSDSILRNVHIRSASINGGKNDNVGMLAGHAQGAMIMNSSAEGEVTNAVNHVGGLIGYGEGAEVISSYAAGRAVSGSRNVGGLIGWGAKVIINSSYADMEDVSGTSIHNVNGSGNNIGGLGW